MLDFIRSHNGMAHHLFMHDKERKLDSRQLMKIFKADLVPMGNNRRMSQEIVLAKFFAFVQSSEGDLFHMHCSQYYEARTTCVNFFTELPRYNAIPCFTGYIKSL